MSNLKVYAKTIEDEALEQINTLLSQDAFKDCKVRIMPDVHAGKGCVIGFTADLGEKVIPNIVGVDIGCGMLCVSIGHGDIDFEKLDNVIRTYVPSGRNVHDGRVMRFGELQDLYCYRELSVLSELSEVETISLRLMLPRTDISIWLFIPVAVTSENRWRTITRILPTN